MARQVFQLDRTQVGVFDALLRARAGAGGKAKILEDHDRKELTYDDLVRASFALGGRIKTFTKPEETVAILLPSGVGATVTFFALHAIGRTPAFLNFTAGALNLKSACATAGVKRILTARKFVEQAKLDDLIAALGQCCEVTFLEDEKAKIGLPAKLGALMAGAFPQSFRAKVRPEAPGVVLFTSGSFGAPKGVVLSHQNLVANVEQAASHIAFDPDWVFFNPLPMFHCFGLTAGTLLPLLTGHKVFLYPSPLHVREIPKLILESKATVLFATDTFAGQYARAAKPDELKGLKFAVLGAERVRDETREIYARKFDVDLLEGYGATEASPIIAVNQPDANRSGTVGKVLPGIEVRLESVPGIHVGSKMLVRGPNVMSGYLRGDGSGAVEPPVDGWHDTGDVVTLDAEGFVTIQGRVKRFAKIGGEMVSLAAVESYASAIWPDHRHAAVSLPCPRKGERVILFTDHAAADQGALLEWAQKNGAPEIAVPKRIVPVPEIPVLGSGKTDYVAIQKLAETQVAEAA